MLMVLILDLYTSHLSIVATFVGSLGWLFYTGLTGFLEPIKNLLEPDLKGLNIKGLNMS